MRKEKIECGEDLGVDLKWVEMSGAVNMELELNEGCRLLATCRGGIDWNEVDMQPTLALRESSFIQSFSSIIFFPFSFSFPHFSLTIS